MFPIKRQKKIEPKDGMSIAEYKAYLSNSGGVSKYKNKKKTAKDDQGRTLKFDSTKEYNRWIALRHMQKEGLISGLMLQVNYPIEHKDIKICSYRADFVYVQGGKTITEDCKGFRTDVYLLKKKLMKAFYGIEILET